MTCGLSLTGSNRRERRSINWRISRSSSGVARVVAAVQDPNPLVAGQGVARLCGAGIVVDTDVLADLSSKKVALLRADWTRRDPAITAALAQLGRNGVPVYVFYKQGRPPVVLSEILEVEEVRSVIANL